MRFIEGVSPPGDSVRFTFEGRPYTGYAGESIASALMRAGTMVLRRTRTGNRARGYYCGMGICWECAVHVEGLGVVRSCSHSVGEGQIVSLADSGCPK
jgi:sarcosine oxidase subunit alpha